MIDPKNVVAKVNTTVFPLLKHFPHIISEDRFQDIDSEWREIRIINFTKLFHDPARTDVESFWQTILKTKRGEELAFPLMGNLISAVLTLAISSANVERSFSAINLNKTKQRNRLKQTTLAGILLTKEYISKNNSVCHSFEPDESLFKKFNNTMYNYHTK